MIVVGAPSPHASVQVESGAHDSEQVSVQRMLHVEPPLQVTLPLAPTVRSQREPPAQLALHELPQAPVQVLSIGQLSVQLSPAQPESPRSQAVPASQAHELPVQAGGGTSSPPQATTAKASQVERANVRMVLQEPRAAADEEAQASMVGSPPTARAR